MKRVYVFLLTVILTLSGCGQGTVDREQGAMGQAAEQIVETETETQPEPMVTICTGIDSEILERDDAFEDMDRWGLYSGVSEEFALIKLDCPAVYQMEPCLYRRSKAWGWTQEDWDLVRPLGQPTTTAMGYGKIDYNNDGKKEYIYRSVKNGMTAIGYEVSEDGKSITGEYDLLQIFAPFYGEEKIPLQLWFRDTGDVVVSYCLLENTETSFTVYAFLVEGDSVSVLEKSMLSVRTKEVPESQIYSEENIFASQSGLRDFVVDDFEAYNLSREELQNLRRDRKIQTIGQETGLPGELAEGLQDILIRKQMGEDVSIGDCLESYETKNCRMDEDLVLEMLEASMSWAELVSAEDAYMADLDGDGKKEIILCGYYGGNGLNFSVEIWRESEEGTGKFIREELGGGRYARLFLIDGAYYYVAGAYSHSLASRVWQVFSFSGGQMVKFGEFAVESRGKEMTWTKFYENENIKPRILESIQAYIEDRKSEIEGEGILQGKSETPMQSVPDGTFADLDNDGETESCFRQIVQNISSAGGPDMLIYDILKKRGPFKKEIEYVFEEEFFPEDIDHYTWQLWFEEFDGKIYTFRLEKLDGSLDCFLNVELIQDNKLYPVMNYFLLDNKVCRYEKADPELYTSYR